MVQTVVKASAFVHHARSEGRGNGGHHVWARVYICMCVQLDVVLVECVSFTLRVVRVYVRVRVCVCVCVCVCVWSFA